MAEEGDLRIFNPDKEISKEITLEILIRHRDAMKQARTGQIPNVEMVKLEDNDRKFNQVRALNLIISSQMEMVTISRPIIYFRSLQKWKKSFKSDEDKEKYPFEKYDCDYNKLMNFLELLRACEKDILEAERTKNLKDDFILKKELTEGDKFELTTNFYDMLNELEYAYEQIYLLMLTNKIVSAGIEEDEELTYKEKEAEAIRRVVEA
jgi:hypothetical protein